MSKRTRNEQLAKEEARIEEAINKNSTIFKSVKQKAKEKKKNHTFEDFIGMGSLFPFVRPIEKWKRKSHNKEKQYDEFLKYAYFKYEAPYWAIEEIKKIHKNVDPKNWEYIFITDKAIYSTSKKDILQCAVSGKGYKELLSHVMSKKEIHSFINSKEETIKRAAMRARLETMFTEETLINFFLERTEFEVLINGNVFLWGTTYVTRRDEETESEYLARRKKSFDDNINRSVYYHLLKMLSKHTVNVNQCQELFDYIRSVSSEYSLHRNDNRRYGFKNRENILVDDKIVTAEEFFKKSFGTIIDLSNRWHIEQTQRHQVKKYPSSWDKKYDDFENGRYKFTELTTSNALLTEGKAMNHCVGSYASNCARGTCNIVSVKKDDGRLLTMEIVNGKIVQIKGKYNRSATDSEMYAVREYANHMRLSVSA